MNALDIKTLKEIRIEKGISVGRLAKLANLSISTIVRTEKGLPVRNSTKVKIAKALKTSPNQLNFLYCDTVESL